MQPRFPLARSFWAALIVAVLAAVAVAVVARLTLPIASEQTEPMGAVTTIGAVTLRMSAGPDATEAEPTAIEAVPAAAADDLAVAAATEPAVPVAEGSGGSTSGGAGSGDAAAGGTATILARVQASWKMLSNTPERWIVLTTFFATLILALLTALIAVRGSASQKIDEGPVRRRSDAVQLLAVLQREGRLVDFLREEIEPYTDAQIGAAARAVHSGCRQALEEHVVLEPVSEEAEGASVIVEDGFDPSVTRLTGNVSGAPPFQGALRHRGWRATEVDLPTDARGQDPEIVAPAEVEIP